MDLIGRKNVTRYKVIFPFTLVARRVMF